MSYLKKSPFSNEKWGVVRVMMISIWKILFILRALNEKEREKDLVHPSIDIFIEARRVTHIIHKKKFVWYEGSSFEIKKMF